MEDCIDSLEDASTFWMVECSSDYWQIPVAELDNHRKALTLHFGAYQYTRMLLGLKNPPAICQRALDIPAFGDRRVLSTLMIFLFL